MDILIEALAWLAAILTLLSFAMKSMMPLRLLALAASVALAIYAFASSIWPLFVASFALLPVNGWRLFEVMRLRQRVDQAGKAREADFSVIKSYGLPVDLAEGAALFRRGDPVDAMYYIEKGKVQLQEIGVELGAGDILGEIGFFTDAEARTATAISAAPTRVYMLTERGFMRLQFQDPSFGMAVMRTVTRRIADGVARNPAAYQGLVAPLADNASRS